MIDTKRANRGLLDPTVGKTNRENMIKKRKNIFFFFGKENTNPKRTGKNPERKTPKELGSLKVELI
jgi:hypothetical protein